MSSKLEAQRYLGIDLNVWPLLVPLVCAQIDLFATKRTKFVCCAFTGESSLAEFVGAALLPRSYHEVVYK